MTSIGKKRRLLSITCLAVGLSCNAASAGDPLDDWSSPRPIKYRPVGSVTTVEPPAPEIFNDLADPVPGYEQASVPKEQPKLADVTTLPPAPPIESTASRNALFPSPEQMVAPKASSLNVATKEPHEIAPVRVANRNPQPTPTSVPSIDAESVLTERGYAPSRITQLQPLPAEAARLPVPSINTQTVSGWQLGRLAGNKITSAEAMMKRRAPMSARQEATEALHLLAQSTDEITRTASGTEAVKQGLVALREAADFLGRFGAVDSEGLQRLVDAHSTRILKRCDLADVSPLRAADTYYEFARGKFVEGVGRWAVASRALSVLAKTEPSAVQQSDGNLSASQICLLRAAIACDPGNSYAANELGHELLTLGLYDEARWALEHSYAKRPSVESLQNLAELHRVTGNTRLARACVTNLATVQGQKKNVAQVMQLSPKQFAQLSPSVMNGGQFEPPGAVVAQLPPTVQPQVIYPDGRTQQTQQSFQQQNAPQQQYTRPATAVPFNPAIEAPSQPGRVSRAVNGVSSAVRGLFR